MDCNRARQAYDRWLGQPTDIQGHLSFLRECSGGFVVELGTRGGVSTSALLAGIEEKGGYLCSVDVDPTCAGVFAGHPAWEFLLGSSIDPLLPDQVRPLLSPLRPRPVDLLFVDTLHFRAHVYRELALWVPLVRPGGRVLVHDAITFYGVTEALVSYAAAHDLPLPEIRPGSNGLGVLKIPR